MPSHLASNIVNAVQAENCSLTFFRSLAPRMTWLISPTGISIGKSTLTSICAKKIHLHQPTISQPLSTESSIAKAQKERRKTHHPANVAISPHAPAATCSLALVPVIPSANVQ